MLQARKDTEAFWKYKESITSVVFENEISVPEEGIKESWDVSTAKDGSVMAYIEDDGLGTDTYKLHIQGNDVIYANIGSSNLFNGFKNTTSIEGLEYLDTSNATNMISMFYGCSALTRLDVSNFDTSNVTHMGSMFQGCSSLTELDVSNFNTANVINMSGMFSQCNKLTELDVSNFNTANVINMSGMFNWCSSLTELDVSNFNTSDVTAMNMMFSHCFNLTTEITIRGNVTSYSTMFSNAATQTGAKITVNYTSDTSLLVDEMLKTKSTNSNVVKGKEEKPLTPQE